MNRGNEYQTGSNLLSFLSVGGVVLSLAMWIALDLLPTGSSPRQTFYSDYAHGPYGYLTPLSLLAVAVALAALSTALTHQQAWGHLPRGLFVASVCLLVPAGLKDDLHGRWETVPGALHLVFAGIAWLALFYVMVMSISQLRDDLKWSRMRIVTATLTAIAIPAYISLPVWGDARGIGQRLFVFPAYAWLLIIGWSAARRNITTAQAPSQ